MDFPCHQPEDLMDFGFLENCITSLLTIWNDFNFFKIVNEHFQNNQNWRHFENNQNTKRFPQQIFTTTYNKFHSRNSF